MNINGHNDNGHNDNGQSMRAGDEKLMNRDLNSEGCLLDSASLTAVGIILLIIS